MFTPRALGSLRRLKAFKKIDTIDTFVEDYKVVQSILEEGVIGVYQNCIENQEENVIFSKGAIYFKQKLIWNRVGYEEICKLVPNEDKNNAKVVKVILSNGKTESFKISGVEGRFRDYFTVYHFLHRIIGDLTK